MVNWKQVVEVIQNEILPYFNQEGVKPTLRTIFYALVSRNVIPNTRNAYNTLSSKLVAARKAGIFPWDFMVDKTRYILENLRDYYYTDEDLKTAEMLAESKLEEIDIERLLDEMFDYLTLSETTDYWAKQPIIPEIWIEKDALAETIDNWVSDLHINIRVCRGYSSWTFIYDNVQAIRELLRRHERVVVLYLGDLDPSGVDIQRFLTEAIEYFGLDANVLTIERLAVTEEQVRMYNLPPRPEDAATLEKLQRDPRTKRYNKPYIVELDALVAYVPDKFRELIRETIEKYHDKDVYNNVKKEQAEYAEKSRKIIEMYKEKAKEKIINQVMGGS